MGEFQKVHVLDLRHLAQTSAIWPCLTTRDSGDCSEAKCMGPLTPASAALCLHTVPGPGASTGLLTACCFHRFLVVFKCVVITGFKNVHVRILGSLGRRGPLPSRFTARTSPHSPVCLALRLRSVQGQGCGSEFSGTSFHFDFSPLSTRSIFPAVPRDWGQDGGDRLNSDLFLP